MAGLDGLRAIAVLLVLGRHVQTPLTGWGNGAAAVMTVWMRGGWIGVDLFFVLSGFLVSGLLFREYQKLGRVSVGRFLVRRGLKIYPAFYAFLALSLLTSAFHWGTPALPTTAVVSELFFVQSYVPGLWWHTWSLAVEEHFYLLCSALFFVLTTSLRGRADPFRAIPWLFGLVAVASLAARWVNGDAQPYADHTHLFATHLRLDGLMFGVFLSYLWHFQAERMERLVRGRETILAIAGVAMFSPAFMFDLRTTPLVYTAGFTLFYVGSGLLVLAVVSRGLPDNIVVRGVARIGCFSYSIYLWHLFVLFEAALICDRYLEVDKHSPIAVSAYMVTSVAIGITMAKLVEFPVLRLRDRLFPSNASPLPIPNAGSAGVIAAEPVIPSA